jgi:hypothetical protein
MIESLYPDDSPNRMKNSLDMKNLPVARPGYLKKLDKEEQERRETVLGSNLSKKF